MKVYVVLEQIECTDCNYCGVYATEENANERISEIVKEFSVDVKKLYITEDEI
jgi:hypothetical protein